MLILLWLPVLCTAAPNVYNFPVPTAEKAAVRGVLDRLPQWISDHFDFEIENDLKLAFDGARISPENGRVFIQGGSGTTVLYAINYYMRNYCKTQITWDGNTYGNGCEDLLEEIYLEAPQVRYFGNQCTFSYSFAWWKWEEWEVFIDWLALNGFNMVLAPVGQEAIWRDVFLELGVSRRDLDSYFTGPAYVAWHRMGNLKGYAGPVSDEFLDAQLELNKLIVARMASIGITPVLPTFAGFVPDALAELHKDKSWERQFIRNSCWDGFNETYSCLASVKPLEDLFTDIGMRFLNKQSEAYGQQYHVYSADPLNEIPQKLTDYKYLKDLSWSVHAACMSGDNKCQWVLQSWTFSYDSWPKQAVKAFLTGIEPGRLLILDLYAEHYPLWSHLKTFYGHPYVWSMLHNFGGNTEIRGNIRHPNKHYQVAMTSGTPMVGGGLTMEGIHQNYFIYQFMIDRMWSRKMLDIDRWVETFVKSRYQTDDDTIVDAWKLIAHTFYAQPLNKSESLVRSTKFEEFIFKRPRLNQSIKYWFPMERLVEILDKFSVVEDALSHNHLFRMDLNDFRRALMQYRLGNDYIMRITEAVGLDDEKLLFRDCLNVQKMFETLDGLANRDYDEWENAAISWATNPEEEKVFSRNARLLVSIWGPQGENLDYAHRSWKGLITKYYAPRWKFLCAWISNNEHLKNQTMFARDIFNSVEKVFVSLGRADIIYN